MDQKSIPSNEIDESLDDWLNSAPQANKENSRKIEHYNQLVHRVFRTEAGQDLLSIWTEALLMNPVANNNSTQIEVGINEGLNQFTRNIIKICKSVEAETNNE